MSASRYEREFKRELEAEGWTVFRSAGSLAIDLIALKEQAQLLAPVMLAGRVNRVMLVEVKSFKGDVFTVKKTKRMLAQWHDMMRLDKKFDVQYALRKKGQKNFRMVKPANLAKPYHWSRTTT